MALLTHIPLIASLLSRLPVACLLAFFSLAATTALRRRRHNLSYRYIPGPKASSRLGYILDLHNPDGLDWHFQMTEKYGHVAKLDGGITKPDALYVTDPAALQAILVRGVDVFRQSVEFKGLFGIMYHGNGVGSVHGDEHREHRKLLDPLFTSARVSRLTGLFYNVTHQLRAALNADIGDQPNGQEINILDRVVRTSLEIIGQACIGHSFDSFDSTSKEFKEFHWALTTILPSASRLFLFLPYFDTWRKMKPVWLRRFLSRAVSHIPWSAPREFNRACELMYPIYQQLLEDKMNLFREGGMSAIEESSTVGIDLMTQTFKANWEAEKEHRMPDGDVLANMNSLVHGAQETTSGMLSHFICLLAEKPELQARLREEIRQAREKKGNDDDFSFSELNGLPLLDAVVRETLRLFAPVTFVWRQTMEDTVVPLKFPIIDKVTETAKNELLITKGTAVYLGLSSANRSKDIWGQDASEFKPERWMGKDGLELTESEGSRLPGIYSNIMTFLGGPRACPGRRFAILEIKLVLAVLLESYAFERSEKDIDWKLYITLTPYVHGDDSESRVPVKVKML